MENRRSLNRAKVLRKKLAKVAAISACVGALAGSIGTNYANSQSENDNQYKVLLETIEDLINEGSEKYDASYSGTHEEEVEFYEKALKNLAGADYDIGILGPSYGEATALEYEDAIKEYITETIKYELDDSKDKEAPDLEDEIEFIENISNTSIKKLDDCCEAVADMIENSDAGFITQKFNEVNATRNMYAIRNEYSNLSCDDITFFSGSYEKDSDVSFEDYMDAASCYTQIVEDVMELNEQQRGGLSYDVMLNENNEARIIVDNDDFDL